MKRVFVLRCHPRVLKARLRSKGWNHLKIQENLLAEILDICFASSNFYYGANRVTQLDTSKTNLKSNVALAKRILMNPTVKRKIRIDWIRQLVREGSFDDYIR